MTATWGVPKNPAIPYAGGYKCLNCNYSFYSRASLAHIVGYNENSGALIFECPQCFELCWYHADEYLLRTAPEVCSRWPKK